jgi:hypothetical protein
MKGQKKRCVEFLTSPKAEKEKKKRCLRKLVETMGLLIIVTLTLNHCKWTCLSNYQTLNPGPLRGKSHVHSQNSARKYLHENHVLYFICTFSEFIRAALT